MLRLNLVGNFLFNLYNAGLIDDSVPHTAFPMRVNNASEVAPRESIEVRALVFYGGFDPQK